MPDSKHDQQTPTTKEDRFFRYFRFVMRASCLGGLGIAASVIYAVTQINAPLPLNILAGVFVLFLIFGLIPFIWMLSNDL